MKTLIKTTLVFALLFSAFQTNLVLAADRDIDGKEAADLYAELAKSDKETWDDGGHGGASYSYVSNHKGTHCRQKHTTGAMYDDNKPHVSTVCTVHSEE